jgi:photosystem II stability/assembly factor-like uncharacterized protein
MFALLAAGCGQPQLTGPDFQPGLWVNLSEKIAQQHPDLRKSDQGFSVTGTLVCLPSSGRLLLAPNTTDGLMVSDDHGQTWRKDPSAGVAGRTYGAYSVDIDPTTGGVLICEIKRKGVPDPPMAMSTDGGDTWSRVNKPKLKAHDGFSWGMVDWAAEDPRVILAKRHHGPPQQWLSTDAGQTWTKLDFLCRNPGVIDANTFVAGIDDSVDEVENGIYLSTDQGRTYRKVSDFVPIGKTPKRWGDRFYWTIESGVIVTDDGGRTWRHTGGKLDGPLWGPYFGGRENQMMCVARDGFWATADGGKTWRKIAEPHVPGEGPFAKSYNIMHPTASFGWNVDKGLLYSARSWWTAERMKLPAGSLHWLREASRAD